VTLHVGLSPLNVVPGQTGGGELYARRLVPALLGAAADLRLSLFLGREAAASFAEEPWSGDVAIVEAPASMKNRPVRVAAEQAWLPYAAHRAGVDLLHNLFNTAPAIPTVPQVTTILDVIWQRFPETQRRGYARAIDGLVRLAARRSRRVVTISEASKADIVELLGVPGERVDVTLLGPSLPPEGAAVAEAELRERLDLGSGPIVLTVSAKKPHKNLERLFEAFARIEADPAPVLVVPGFATFHEERLREAAGALASANRICFAGWVDEPTLTGLYRAARLLVFPSLAEGFGLPVLDALVQGAPVACSRTSSLPEVAGDAAVYFDPLDVEDMRRAIEELLRDEALRTRLIELGRERARGFTWSAPASATVSSDERALGG
jgi:glycosyltransferase involved in cell wall biosynthesis